MSNTSNNPHAWLGLLKWSLSYTDGTKPSPTNDELNPLSKEDIKFLEDVMNNGIVDETTRINEILNLFIPYLEDKINIDDTSKKEKVEDDDTMIDLLWELRDLIGLIDYSRVFVTMGGLPFLIGCISQTKTIDTEIRGVCLVLLSTLCQNNPFVQCAALELKLPVDGGEEINIIYRLMQLHALENSNQMKSRIIQALSCIIRNNSKTEEEICHNATFVSLLHEGLGIDQEEISESLQKRCLFLLQALLCSDTTSYDRIQTFTNCMNYIIQSILLLSPEATSLEIREISLQFLHTILSQNINIVQSIYDNKNNLIDYGINVIAKLNDEKDQEEKERMSVECDLWRDVIDELRKLGDQPIPRVEEQEQVEASEPVLMLGPPPTHDTFAQ